MKRGILKPMTPGGINQLSKVIKIVKTIWDIICDKPAKKLSKTDSIKDNQSLENINEIFDIFSEYKEQVHKETGEIEKLVRDEVDYYVEELKEILEEENQIADKYGIRLIRLEKRADKIAIRAQDCINREVSKYVSLDNAECRSIMMMISGQKKEDAMRSFLKRAFQNALEVSCQEINYILEEIFEEAENAVLGAVEEVQILTEKNRKELEDIDMDNYSEKASIIFEIAGTLFALDDVVKECLAEV